MKRNFFTALLTSLLMLTGYLSFSQAGIYIYSTQIPGSITSGTHINETPIAAFSRNYSTPIITGGPSPVPGAAQNGGFTLQKSYTSNSLTLMQFLWAGTQITRLEVRFYNTTDQLYYRITYGGLYILSYDQSGEGCVSGCPGMQETIKLILDKVKEEDVLAGTSKCWGFNNNSPICP
jgi:type VI protein secretion system component Hcp